MGFLWPEWLSFDGLIKWAHDAAVKIWEFLRDLVWGLLSTLFSSLASVMTTVGGYMTTAVSGLGAFTDYLAFANAWVPVDLFFQLLVAYTALAAAVFVYRTVKSWIPTVSGGG